MNSEVDDQKRGNILYFEDDADVAELTSCQLDQRGFSIWWYQKYPSAGIDAIVDGIGVLPDIILLDINMPERSGFDILKDIQSRAELTHIPVLFISGEASDEEVLRAYEAGGHDYLVKPVRMDELVIKIDRYIKHFSQVKVKELQITDAQTMAFDAMAANSELGKIIRFFEESAHLKSFYDLGKLFLDSIGEFGVAGSVMFFTGNDEFYLSCDGIDYPLERKTIKAARNSRKIVDVGEKSLFNYPKVSLLIKNMPVDNPVRYGHLKDQLCIFLNGVAERVESLHNEHLAERQSEHISIVANVMAQMVLDMEKNSVKLSKALEDVIIELESKISAELVGFNLLEEEEKVLIQNISQSIEKASSLFDTSVEFEAQYNSVIQSLLKDLKNNAL